MTHPPPRAALKMDDLHTSTTLLSFELMMWLPFLGLRIMLRYVTTLSPLRRRHLALELEEL